MPCLFHHSASPTLTAPVRPARAKRISHDIKIRSHIAKRGRVKTRRGRFIF